MRQGPSVRLVVSVEDGPEDSVGGIVELSGRKVGVWYYDAMSSQVVTRAFRNKVVTGSVAEVVRQLRRLALRV
ncbi:MAG: hypothetical protein AB1704_07860 [Pseudomonadota bacterium]|jgi:hypothetical protein|uniref:hypothetical protein n=1 Tax=Burkholderiaceae TaxID=119060 RepID=UPI0010F9FF01|nr:hypothetical protein [Burkholderia sp. 4M9327F10]